MCFSTIFVIWATKDSLQSMFSRIILIPWSSDTASQGPGSLQRHLQEHPWRDFPGGPVVKSLPSNEEDVGSIHGQGTKIPQAAGQLSLSTTTEESWHATAKTQRSQKKNKNTHGTKGSKEGYKILGNCCKFNHSGSVSNAYVSGFCCLQRCEIPDSNGCSKEH